MLLAWRAGGWACSGSPLHSITFACLTLGKGLVGLLSLGILLWFRSFLTFLRLKYPSSLQKVFAIWRTQITTYYSQTMANYSLQAQLT